MKKYLFHISGMHCKSCVVLSESEVLELKEVVSAKASLAHHTLEVEADLGDKELCHVMDDLNVVLKLHGYTLSLEKKNHDKKWGDFIYAVPMALGFIILFVALQKLGIVNLIGGGKVGYGTAFLIGLIASVSSCMAVVGGLVLSMSANFTKEGDKIRPQISFHLGRLISFFVFGGVIGALGSVFQLGLVGTFWLGMGLGLVMIILGVNLLDIFPGAKRFQVTLPGFLGRWVHTLKNLNHSVTPFLVGVVTFFLPCGFTQSMQIYALSTGSFFAGAMFMLVFALGTLPVLGLISFSYFGVSKKSQSGVFFKTAGLIVIFFGIFNIINSLVAAGIILPLYSF